MRHVAYKTWAQGRLREITRPARPLQQLFREKTRPARQKTPILSHFERAGRTFSRSRPHQATQGELNRAHAHIRPHRANLIALTPTSGHAGRTFSRTRRDNMAPLKPPTPLHTPNKGPLKPASPLRPKTATKTPISHPQRRWRFHLSSKSRPHWCHRFQADDALHRIRRQCTR